MEIVKGKSLKQYRSFIDTVYHNDPFFKDNKSAILPLVCGRQSAFYNHSWQEIISVCHAGKMLCQCILIQHQDYKDTMMMAFFEALPEVQEAVEFLSAYARQQAAIRGCSRVVAGLEGHCNYSVGFLENAFDQSPSFGQAYNPPYYGGYFREMGWERVGLLSLQYPIASLNTRLFKAAEKLNSGVMFEYGDFGLGLRKTISRYTKLSNEIFTNHRYCFYRHEKEDYELFKPMRYLLKPDNLIFALCKGKTVGFLLWYPDFNEFVQPGKSADFHTFINYRLRSRFPTSLKVTEIGVLPKYRKRGLILQLFGELHRLAAIRYPKIKTVKSSWILEENEDSKIMSAKILKEYDRSFSVYETTV